MSPAPPLVTLVPEVPDVLVPAAPPVPALSVGSALSAEQ